MIEQITSKNFLAVLFERGTTFTKKKKRRKKGVNILSVAKENLRLWYDFSDVIVLIGLD